MPKLKRNSNSTETITKGDFAEEVEALEEEKLELPRCDVKVNEKGESEEFKLLAGYIDEDGTMHDTFVIREMNGKDEEIINQGNTKLVNGAKVINTLLARCVVRIGSLYKKDFASQKDWENIIKKLYIGDQDYILLKIRELSLGKEIECSHQCPYCKSQITTYVDTDEFEIIPFSGERTIYFELPRGYTDTKGKVYSSGTLRLANGVDREVLTPKAKKNIGVANTLMLARLVTFDNGMPTTEDVIRNLTVRDREYLFKLMNENAFGPKTVVEVECPECGEEFSGNLNAVNFI